MRTFRLADGLWEEHHIDDVATFEGFRRNPKLVHDFYNARRRQLVDVEPNSAHRALAEFEKTHEGEFLLITQNVDDLHERAGSQRLLHMHGTLKNARCVSCGIVITAAGDLSPASTCTSCGGELRPDIVWFGEMPYHLNQINEALCECTLFVSIGTSGNVYPAAGFVQMAKSATARCVEFNLEKTVGGCFFDDGYYGRSGETVPAFFNRVIESQIKS